MIIICVALIETWHPRLAILAPLLESSTSEMSHSKIWNFLTLTR